MDGARDVESLWRSRLRWRLRGALLWPAFVVLTLVDALILGRLPIAGDGGTAFVPALLLACFFNLLAVAVAGPLLATVVRRRVRRDLPRVVAEDYTGTALLGVVTAGLLAGGIAHHDSMQEAQHDLIVQQAAARAYASERAPARFRGRVEESTTVKLEEDLFRTCVPGPDPRRWFCVFVRTNTAPPGITVDQNRESNASFQAAGGFARR